MYILTHIQSHTNRLKHITYAQFLTLKWFVDKFYFDNVAERYVKALCKYIVVSFKSNISVGCWWISIPHKPRLYKHKYERVFFFNSLYCCFFFCINTSLCAILFVKQPIWETRFFSSCNHFYWKIISIAIIENRTISFRDAWKKKQTRHVWLTSISNNTSDSPMRNYAYHNVYSRPLFFSRSAIHI